MDTKEKFFRVYANLPINLRKEIIAIIDDKPISWNVAYLEINANTKLSETILDKLEALEVI